MNTGNVQRQGRGGGVEGFVKLGGEGGVIRL